MSTTSSLTVEPSSRPLTPEERLIIEAMERREFIVGGAAAAALVVAGCGNDDDEGANGDGVQAEAESTAPPASSGVESR